MFLLFSKRLFLFYVASFLFLVDLLEVFLGSFHIAEKRRKSIQKNEKYSIHAALTYFSLFNFSLFISANMNFVLTYIFVVSKLLYLLYEAEKVYKVLARNSDGIIIISGINNIINGNLETGEKSQTPRPPK